MADVPESFQFETSDQLLEYLREHTDDIDSVVIPVQEGITFVGPQGQQMPMKNIGAILNRCAGGPLVIHREDAAMLINDGVLQRLRIKCILDPLPRP